MVRARNMNSSLGKHRFLFALREFMKRGLDFPKKGYANMDIQISTSNREISWHWHIIYQGSYIYIVPLIKY
jgi:hypothetical protein